MASSNSFANDVDFCISSNYQLFYQQAVNNVKAKYPHLNEAQVKILAERLILVVKEDFKLQQETRGTDMVATASSMMDTQEIEISRLEEDVNKQTESEDLRRLCLVTNTLRRSLRRRQQEVASTTV